MNFIKTKYSNIETAVFKEEKKRALTGRDINITDMPSQRPTKWSQEEPEYDAQEWAGPESSVRDNMKDN